MRKHSQRNNDERTQFFRKIYLSHFIRNGCERVMCERWVGDWTKLQHIDPPSSSGYSSTSFSLGCSTGGSEGRKPGAGSHAGILSLKLWLQIQTDWTSCRIRLYHCLKSTCFLWVSHLHRIQPVHSQGYPLISSTGCSRCLHRCISYLTARPGRRSICYTNTLIRGRRANFSWM